jgi:hypothetical protein
VCLLDVSPWRYRSILHDHSRSWHRNIAVCELAHHLQMLKLFEVDDLRLLGRWTTT